MGEAAVLIFFPLLMVYAALSDVATMLISNRVSLLLALGFAPIALLVGTPIDAIGLHLLCGLAVFVITFVLFSVNIIGGGDAKLASATAIWLGFDGLLNYGVMAAMIGGAMAIGILAIRKLPLPSQLMKRAWIARLHDPKEGIPYGVALAIAGLIIYPESLVWLRAIGA